MSVTDELPWEDFEIPDPNYDGSDLLDAAHLKDFLSAGHATVTIENPETGGRFTFRVDAPYNREARRRRVEASYRHVRVLTGPDNTRDYTYLGTVMLLSGEFKAGTREGAVSRDADSFRAFRWLWGKAWHKVSYAPARVLHDGRCGRCGRKLTTPESIRTGIGPVCAGK